MIGLLLPLRWMLYQGATPTPVYGDAPEERYVWAPPDVRASAVFPADPPAVVDPTPGATVGAEARFSSVSEDSRTTVVPFDPRSSTA